MTDDELIEAMAREIFKSHRPDGDWDGLFDQSKEWWKVEARAALAIVRPVIEREALSDRAAQDVEAMCERLEKAKRERNSARSEISWLAKLLMRTRNAFGYIVSEIEDEGDRTYFGSSNHANELRDLLEQAERWDEERIMRDGQWPDYITKCREANERTDAAQAEAARLRGALDELLDEDSEKRSIVNLCYTAFMNAHQPNAEDGGQSDWFNDTKPIIIEAINKIRAALRTEGERG